MPGAQGRESSPEIYVADLGRVFDGVWRALKDDGTLWLNLGDCYAGGGRGGGGSYDAERPGWTTAETRGKRNGKRWGGGDSAVTGLAAKQLIGLPWWVAFTLQADGWYLRSDIIWSKPNPMPESVKDRPTRAHEYIFLLSKSPAYFYDADAIAEPSVYGDHARNGTPDYIAQAPGQPKQAGITRRRRSVARGGFNGKTEAMPGRNAFRAFTETRNARTVWEIPTQPYAGAHFAAFPEELARRCILAGSRPGDIVLDPFGGSGTVAAVATGMGRHSIYIDLNPKYLELAKQRIGPLLCDMAVT